MPSAVKSLSLIGMSKNAGKTTVLNAILKCFSESDTVLGLTSIGRDGEDIDIVTNTGKPRIYVKQGTIFATAASLLTVCDTTREILQTTGINTPMGEVIIVRGLTGGYVQLAGPSINSQISGLCDVFRSFGAEFIIVDGAFSRKTLASPAVTDYTVLCAGASLSRNIHKVVAETAHVHDLLKSPAAAPGELEASLGFRVAVIDDKGCQGFGQAALTDSLANELIKRGGKNSTIIADDASKLLISSETHRRLKLRNIKLCVRKRTELLAVTVNPISAYGYDFDIDIFKKMLSEAVDTPVFDVLREGAALYDLLV